MTLRGRRGGGKLADARWSRERLPVSGRDHELHDRRRDEQGEQHDEHDGRSAPHERKASKGRSGDGCDDGSMERYAGSGRRA